MLTSRIVAGNVQLSKMYEKNGKTCGYWPKRVNNYVPLARV